MEAKCEEILQFVYQGDLPVMFGDVLHFDFFNTDGSIVKGVVANDLPNTISSDFFESLIKKID